VDVHGSLWWRQLLLGWKAAVTIGEDGGGGCWGGRRWRLLAPGGGYLAFVFPGSEGDPRRRGGGVVKKPVAPEGRGQEGLLAKCTVTVDA
jgi:hypothetical protein